ncbi:hypothetical protein SAMN06297251_13117 [Fulvimarina manganoxydans]|uniref:HTH cro/C1-type domain-containing protein n=1 Tax=Fulvimarina manganoxydans TaxID=937218 RepID=A0A1W2EQY0_9HYPH|nr:helix-turn-helix transcriptional regulator [Fulvimarina manganoxydans]SMD12110.1 hypothetical protein SAMN06297251_13117 [Fulvimarina manganoxydans]
MARVVSESGHQKIIAADFAKRLNIAADSSDRCPPLHRGRYEWLIAELNNRYDIGITKETARKWFSGEARPRANKASQVAEVFQVDSTWLLHGIGPHDDPADEKQVQGGASAAVNLLAGMLMALDVPTAFPGTDDPLRDSVSLYAVIARRQVRLHATWGDTSVKGRVKFIIPNEHEIVNVIGVIPGDTERCFRLFHIVQDAISKYGRKRGGYIEISMVLDDAEMQVEDIRIPEIKALKAML